MEDDQTNQREIRHQKSKQKTHRQLPLNIAAAAAYSILL